MSSQTPPPLDPPTPPPAPLRQMPPPTVAFHLAWLPEERDWVEAFAAVSRAQLRRSLAILLAAPCLIAVLGLSSHNPTTVVMAIVMAIFFLGIFGPLRTHTVRSAVRRSPALLGYRQVQLSPEAGVTEWFPGACSMNAWWRWKAVIETERAFVLVLGDIHGNAIGVLAKRGLPPGVDPRLLGDFLRAHIGGPAVR